MTVGAMCFVNCLYGQTNQIPRMIIPWFAQNIQSNIDVKICDLNSGKSCPLKYKNTLSNTNLFSEKQQKFIAEIFLKYKNVTTNVGPSGTVLADLYKTNLTIATINKTLAVEKWVARYQYTNTQAYEEITFGGTLSAKFRTKSDDGYNVYFNRIGGGTTLRYMEVRRGLVDGLFAEFLDMREQGAIWDYKFADFTNCSVTEYRQYTNGLVVGNFLCGTGKPGI